MTNIQILFHTYKPSFSISSLFLYCFFFLCQMLLCVHCILAIFPSVQTLHNSPVCVHRKIRANTSYITVAIVWDDSIQSIQSITLKYILAPRLFIELLVVFVDTETETETIWRTVGRHICCFISRRERVRGIGANVGQVLLVIA